MPERLVGKYMKAEIMPPEKNRKTRSYCVREIGTGLLLGKISWYGPWRGYCFFPNHGTVFDGGCLRQIDEWLSDLTNAYKEAKKAGAPKADEGVLAPAT